MNETINQSRKLNPKREPHADTGRRGVILIGAGISGVLAARTLQEGGISPMILEKSRGFGGRMATRRWDGFRVDHGAQCLAPMAVTSEVFSHLIKEGHLRRWPNWQEERWIGPQGMSGVVRQLAAGLEARLQAEVQAVAWNESRWQVTQVSGEQQEAKAIILSAPAPQALALLEAGKVPLPEAFQAKLRSFRYERCLTLMVLLAGASRVPAPGFMELDDDRLARIADNRQKGLPQPEEQCVLTLHSTHEFALSHWEADPGEIERLLLESAGPWLGSQVLETRFHRWRYSFAANPTGERYLGTTVPGPLLVCGDAFGAGRIEGAVRSGCAAGKALLEMLEHGKNQPGS